VGVRIPLGAYTIRGYMIDNFNESNDLDNSVPPLTPEQYIQSQAFMDGARYMFNRLGNWYGRDHMFYLSYFKDCIARGEEPRPVSMIAEEIYYLSDEYARGSRFDRPNL
jgi:hypothetical protein